MSDWHMSFGMGEDSGGLLSWGFAYIKEIIKKIAKKISEVIRRKPRYDYSDFKIKIEKLSIAQPEDASTDVSQLQFEKPLLDFLTDFTKEKRKV